MVYQWKAGAHFKADANAVAAELASIGSQIRPTAVVQKAKSKKSAMHNCFEWDDGIAANEYRLTQARSLLRSIVTVVEKEDEPDGVTTIRTYEHVDLGPENSPRQAYVPTVDALRTPDLRAQIIGRLNRDIQEAERTAEKYEYLCMDFATVKERLASAREAMPAL